MKSVSFLVMILLVFSVTSYSQSGNEILTLNDCVKIALDNNSDLNTSRNLAKISQLGVKGSYSNILPSVDASFQGGNLKFGPSTFVDDVPVGYDIVNGDTIVQYEQQNLSRPAQERKSYSAGFSVSQNIFDGGYW